MAYTTIDDPSAYFQTALWSGDGSTNNAITNDGNSNLQPDFVWIKKRTNADDHILANTSSGATKYLIPNTTGTEQTYSGNVKSFDSNGFTVGDGNQINQGSNTFVGWQWKANGGTTTTNDASSTGVGTIDSVYQANTTAGFSIVTHTGSGSAGNIAHGLGAVPEWILTKNRSQAASWANYHVGIGNGYYLELDTDDAKESASSVWGDTTPSSTTFRVGGANTKNNSSSNNFVSFCFTPIQGYSKFGSYTGNGNADGPFVYTGFKPAWLLIKNTAADANWMLLDNKRDPFNDATPAYMDVDLNNAENTSSDAPIDFLSNGFKVRTTSSIRNPNGEIVVYMAFAESPFVSSEGVPTTAR